MNQNDMEIYKLSDEIFRHVRIYHTKTYTLPDVARRAAEYMKSGGYQVAILDDHHRDYKILGVDNHRFRLVRYKNCPWYEVEAID